MIPALCPTTLVDDAVLTIVEDGAGMPPGGTPTIGPPLGGIPPL